MLTTQAPDPFALQLDGRSFRRLTRVWRDAGKLRVFVPYTSVEMTKAALQKAVALTGNLNAHITLFAAQVVPFPLPLYQSSVSPAFLEQRLLAIAGEAGGSIDVQVILARDLELGIQRVLPPNSLVMVATKKRWWPSLEAKLARTLVRAGHSVALVAV